MEVQIKWMPNVFPCGLTITGVFNDNKVPKYDDWPY